MLVSRLLLLGYVGVLRLGLSRGRMWGAGILGLGGIGRRGRMGRVLGPGRMRGVLRLGWIGRTGRGRRVFRLGRGRMGRVFGLGRVRGWLGMRVSVPGRITRLLLGRVGGATVRGGPGVGRVTTGRRGTTVGWDPVAPGLLVLWGRLNLFLQVGLGVLLLG